MKKNLLKTFLSAVLAVSFVTGAAACGNSIGKVDSVSTDGGSSSAGGDEDTVYNATLLVSGWTNTPTTADDPYKAWIRENYGLNVSLNATTDFDNSVTIGFSSKNKPDIVSFPTFTSFQTVRKQGVLLEDWTPYLEKTPNFKKLLTSDSQKFTRQIMTDENGKLNAIWTPATPPTWSLKIREDWATEYRADTNAYDENGNVTTKASDIYIPAGATCTKGGEWMPDTPEDLIYFARWIKVFKNKGLSKTDYYGFTTAGGKTSLGTLETWMPLMWGRVPVVPYGFYIDKNGEVQFSTTDGSYEPYLNYLRQICDEGLIDPSWFSQTFSDDKRTTSGKIGIQWYPGSISTSTQIDANAGRGDNDQIDTTEWWMTYPLPVSEDAANEYAGYMAGQGLAGNIITVSKQTALNKPLMERICKLIDDCYAYHDEEKNVYERGVAYDALRWGVGIESSISYQTIEGSPLVYCNTAGDDNTYRGRYSGAWDWGAWISSSYDGVVQGTSEEITGVILKVAEHDLKTATFKTTPQIGEFLDLDSSKVNDVVADMVSFAYKYATRQTNTSVADYCRSIKTNASMRSLKEEAGDQFKKLGLIY